MKNKRIIQLLAIASASVLMTTTVPAAEKAPWDKDNNSKDRWEYTLDDIREAMNDPLKSEEMEKFLLKKGYVFSTATGMPELITKLEEAKAAIPSGGVENTIPPAPAAQSESAPSDSSSTAEAVPSISESAAEPTGDETVKEDVTDTAERADENASESSEQTAEDTAASSESIQENVPSAGESTEENAPSSAESKTEDASSSSELTEENEALTEPEENAPLSSESAAEEETSEAETSEDISDKKGFSFENDLLEHDGTLDETEIVQTEEALLTVPGIAGTSGEHLLLTEPSSEESEEVAAPVVSENDLNGTPTSSDSLNQAGPGSTEIVGTVDKPVVSDSSASASTASQSGTASGSSTSSQSGSNVNSAQNTAPKTGDAGEMGHYGMMTAVSAAMAGMVLFIRKRISGKKETTE